MRAETPLAALSVTATTCWPSASVPAASWLACAAWAPEKGASARSAAREAAFVFILVSMIGPMIGLCPRSGAT
jgi:hypothetical protein